MSVVAAAFVPMSPLLFRHLSGAADPVAELREAAVAAVREACACAEQVLLLCPVGGREAPGDWRDPARAAPPRGEPRSLAQQVGEHLLELAGITLPAAYLECGDGEPGDGEPGVGRAAVAADAPSRGRGGNGDGALGPATALVVLGDGAAARSQGAPGHIDERSFGFDDAVAAALASGDGTALADLAADPAAVELMVAGRHSWPVAAGLVPHPSAAVLAHRSDPFGLTYFVALWRR